MFTSNPLDDLRNDVHSLTAAAGYPISESAFVVIDRAIEPGSGTTHKAEPLPSGKRAVYIFLHGDKFLKIGKVGPKSAPRFLSHHYHVTAKSSLARSILDDPEFADLNLNDANIKNWITSNVRRIDIIFESTVRPGTTSLIEAGLQYKYQPNYEGALR